MKFFKFSCILIYIFFSFGSYSAEKKNSFKDIKFFYGDPSENQIISEGELYLVIYNQNKYSHSLMKYTAGKFCRSKLGDQYGSVFYQIINDYSIYASCESEDPLGLNKMSNEYKTCILDIVYKIDPSKRCVELKLTNSNDNVIKELKKYQTEEMLKTNKFIYSVVINLYPIIKKLENNAELNKNIERLNKEKSMFESLLSLTKKHNDICNAYNIEKNSEKFEECLIELMKASLIIKTEQFKIDSSILSLQEKNKNLELQIENQKIKTIDFDY